MNLHRRESLLELLDNQISEPFAVARRATRWRRAAPALLYSDKYVFHKTTIRSFLLACLSASCLLWLRPFAHDVASFESVWSTNGCWSFSCSRRQLFWEQNVKAAASAAVRFVGIDGVEALPVTT